MARVPAAAATGDVAERVKLRRGGHLTPLDDVLLHSAPLADGWNHLLGAIRSQMDVPAALRELAICRIAAINGAAYEWNAHAPLAIAAGVSDEQLSAARVGDTSAMNDEQRLVVAYTDAMTQQVEVPRGLSASVHNHFGTKQFVELTATIAGYNMVSRFLVALEIGHEGSTIESEIR